MLLKKNMLLLLILICSVQLLSARTEAKPYEFYGKVAVNGKGVAAVPVTDGKEIVLTDQSGHYKIISLQIPDFIYISIPSPYKIPIKEGRPNFYQAITDQDQYRQQINFNLEQLATEEVRHKLIVCADPQVAFEEELVQLQAASDDIKKTAESFTTKSVYGIVCGDIISDIRNSRPSFRDVETQLSATGVPFFYVSGNHDIDSVMRSNEQAKNTYQQYFGPRYYSFNRGKIHYLVLDDVFSTGRNNEYIGYLEEKQLHWLEQDLALVPKNSTVILSLHIPTFSPEAREGQYAKEDIKKVLQNRRALYALLAPFRVHILSGHEHYQENYQINDGIFEHVNGALCGIFWQAPYNSDGTPTGYTVFEIEGDKLTWYFKAIGLPKADQFMAYPISYDSNRPDAIVANVWNVDPNWKVYWYEDGVKMGEMSKFMGWDPFLVNYVKQHIEHFRYKYIGAGPTAHLFWARPTNPSARITIEVVDRFGKSYKKPLTNQ